MNKLLFLTATCLLLAACSNYNAKQKIDETYYKKTQSVAWPTEQKATPVSKPEITYTK